MTSRTTQLNSVPLWIFLIATLGIPLTVDSPASAQTKESEGPKQRGEKTQPTETKNASSADIPQEITYRGQLQDEDGAPISGIFHLEFNLYPTENASEAKWSTRHFVAVADGEYRVPLGAKNDLPKKLVDRSSFIGVALVGEGEIMRDRLRIRSPEADQSTGEAERRISQETEKLLEKAKKSKDMAFANIAENALSADHAKVADKVGDLTAKEIRELAKSDERAMKKLGEHIADPKAHQNQIGGGVGDAQRVMRSVGGSGGKQYSVDCPDGYVVTGIQGGAGRLVDRIAIVCSPLK